MSYYTTRQIKSFFSILSLFIFSYCALGQRILTDTSFIQFKADPYIPVNYMIRNISDARGVTENAVGYGYQKKFLIIPVDREICLKSPLSEEIQNSINNSSKNKQETDLEIKHFIIKKELRRFSGNYLLEADFLVKQNNKYIGYLSYNYRSTPSNKKASTEKIYEQLIEEWHPAFKIDLGAALNYSLDTNSYKPETFISEEYHRYNFFNISLATVVGLDFWQIDGEISFNRPETPNSNIFQGSIIRYQNTKDFEVIAFGKRSEHYLYRINPATTFHLNSNFLIGINKWRNTEDIKLQQALQIALSSYQTISLNKENKTGINLKAGLFENLYYIIEKPLKFQAGIYAAVGYKL